MQKYDVAIIGGGASGLSCAVSLKRMDPSLTIVIAEEGERLGRKLAASGNGQGNVSNADMGERHFHGSFAPLAYKLCNSEEYDRFSLFDCIFTQDGNGRIYPAGKQASALTDCLIRGVQRYGAEVLYSAKVTDLKRGFFLTLSDGKRLAAERVVLATGGKAQKQFGTDGSSYALARSLGHTFTPLYPSLVQLRCDTRFIKQLKGIRAVCAVTARSGEEELARTVGDVIFTDYGVSGSAVFYISAYCAGREGVTLNLEFLPDVTQEKIEEDVRKKLSLGYPVRECLAGTLHNQIGRAVVKRCASDEPSAIARAVKNFTLDVHGSLGFEYAQVTKGGIPAEEVGEDLQSKIVDGLYFTGEVLDLDGDCGGYNLSWAFVSGMHAAKNIINGMATYD